MTLPQYVTRSCSCTAPKGMGYPRPDFCECGNRFVTEKQLRPRNREEALKTFEENLHPPKPRRRSGPRRSEPRRDWTLANAKREEEGDLCRVTGEAGTELAHILGRRYDEPISPGSKTLLVLPDRVVPLAPRIHTAYDAHEFDLLPYLTAAEQAQAVLDAGSMGLALKRISPMLEMAA